MAAAVDVGLLSRHLGLTEDAITVVANNPTAALVEAVLEAVTAKAREYDVFVAQKLDVDVTLETTVRNSEARSLASKSTADKALKDVEDLRRKLQEEGMYLYPVPHYCYRVVFSLGPAAYVPAKT